MLYRSFTATEVEAAVKLSMEKGISSSEGVRHLLYVGKEVIQTVPALSGWNSLPPTDVAKYGQLGGVQ